MRTIQALTILRHSSTFRGEFLPLAEGNWYKIRAKKEQDSHPIDRLFCSVHYLFSCFFASPSGKMILNTKKKITMDTPPVITVTRIL